MKARQVDETSQEYYEGEVSLSIISHVTDKVTMSPLCHIADL